MPATIRLRSRAARAAFAGLAPSAILFLGAASAAPAPAGLDFAGISLGMSLRAWKAAPIPGPPSPGVQPVCADRPTGAAAGLIPAARQADVTVCTYQKRYGRFTLPQTIALGPKVKAKDLRFTFTGGHLTGIDYQTSVDVFSDLTARLTKRYGPPSERIHDNLRTELGAFPRVRESWNTPLGRIQLVDPVASLGAMSVGLVARPTPAPRPS